MPLLDDINRVLRDFERYTGDGKPGAPSGAPLPTGDPSSGVHNLRKHDLRELLKTIAQTMGDPSALQEILADLDAKAPLANSGKSFPSRASAAAAGQNALPASLGLILHPEGDYIVVRGFNAATDDPLFPASEFPSGPRWGVILRLPSQALLDRKADQSDLLGLSARVNDGVVPPLTAYDGQAVSSSDGTLFASSAHQTLEFSCSPGENYDVSYYSSGSTYVAAIAFYTSSGSLVAALSPGTGTAREVVRERVTVPPLATTMRVCGRRADTSNNVRYSPIPRRVMEAPEGVVPRLSRDVERLRDAASDFMPVPLSVTPGRYVSGSSGSIVSVGSTGWSIYEFGVNAGDTIKFSMSWLGSDIPKIAYYDANGVYVGSTPGLGPSGSVPTLVVDEITVVPPRATVARISQRDVGTQAVSVARLQVVDTRPRVEAIEEALHDFVDDTPALIDGSYFSALNGSVVAGATYHRLIADVTPGETLYLSADYTGGALALAVFLNASMGLVKAVHINPGGGVLSRYTREPVVVPAGAAYVGMSQSKGEERPLVLERVTLARNLPARVASLEAGGSSWWTGKSVAWFGTSIPAGTSRGGRYPNKVAAALGAEVYNEAVSGSAVTAGNRANVTADDPRGWTGNRWLPCALGLAGTIAEKQYLIDNWATVRPLFSNAAQAPATLDAATRSQILDSSYENKLVRHLGANRRDVYVFDHGYNDVSGMGHDPSGGANSGVDRLDWYGAHNFLTDLILRDNPRALILFVSHFERWTGTGAKLVAGQRALAEMYGRPLCDLSAKLGWTQRPVVTTGYWDWVVQGSEGTWVPSGGPETTMTELLTWCPDGTHPANDYSGGAVQRIADVLVPWFRAQEG